MDFSAMQTALTTWIETLSGLDSTWEEEPMPMFTDSFLILSMGAFAPNGRDGIDLVYDSGSDTTTLNMFGIREFTFTVRARAFDQRAAYAATQALERARILMTSPSSIDTLTEAGVALVGTQPLVTADYDFDGRRISQINMDVRLATMDYTEDPSWDGTYINRVTGTGTEVLPDASEQTITLDIQGS